MSTRVTTSATSPTTSTFPFQPSSRQTTQTTPTPAILVTFSPESPSTYPAYRHRAAAPTSPMRCCLRRATSPSPKSSELTWRNSFKTTITASTAPACSAATNWWSGVKQGSLHAVGLHLWFAFTLFKSRQLVLRTLTLGRLRMPSAVAKSLLHAIGCLAKG